MFISIDEEEISLPLQNGTGEGSIESYPLGSNPDLIDAELPVSASEFPESLSHDENHHLEHSITTLEGEILELRLRQKSIDDKRREALNKILEIKGCIRVFCRVRPCLLTDRRRIHRPISVESEKIVVRSGGTRKEFGIDKVFQQEATQDDVFVEVAPILRSALDGHNVCILAYGQTGTGKTFTMDGTDDSPGIVPRVLKEIFRQASVFDTSSSVTFSISMLEVYLGHLRDLLAPKMPNRTYSVSRCNLNIQTDPKGTVEIEGLTDVEISNFSKASWWYTKGRRVRSTSWTNVNESSSRSHCLTRITIYRRLMNGDGVPGKTEISKLWMVDLGGSERLLKTGATGQTLDEGRAINLSLSALGDVIAALRRKKGHVPYRNSKLTQILRDSLGDGSKALMLVHVSPYEEDVGETTCSFTFAKRARAVESNRELPEELRNQKQKKISELEEKMKEAEVDSQKIRNQIQKAEFLLSENRKILSTSYHLLEEDEEKVLRNPKELIETPRNGKPSRRSISSSVPRFMRSTVASRERQTAAEKEIDKRARTVRLGTRSLIQMSGSQSNSCSDPRFKALLKNPNKKSRYGEVQIQTSSIDNAKCNDTVSKVSCVPRSKVLASSDPNLRVTLSRHRRRMSDLS